MHSALFLFLGAARVVVVVEIRIKILLCERRTGEKHCGEIKQLIHCKKTKNQFL